VKRILAGTAPDIAASRGALQDPHSLEPFETFARRRSLIDLTVGAESAGSPVPAATITSEE
jgi:hypothetical protein